MNSRVVVEIREENKAFVFVRGLEPYEAVRVLLSIALALLEGRADASFHEGPPLTEEEEQEIVDCLMEGSLINIGGGQRDN